MTTTEKLRNYIKARYPGVALRTSEEPRALEVLKALAKELKQNLFVWTASSGIDRVVDGNGLNIEKSDTELLGSACRTIMGTESDQSVGLIALADVAPWIPKLDPQTERAIKDLLIAAPGKGACVIFVGVDFPIPRSFEKSVSILDFTLPTQEDLEKLLVKADKTAKDSFNGNYETATGLDRQAILRAARGLTEVEAENAFCLSSIIPGKPRRIMPEIVYNEKAAAVRRSGLMELIEPDPRGLEAIGGLDRLKSWILQRTECYSEKAKAFGLPSPRGVLVCGISGTGKSAAAKCIGSVLKVPTLRLDMGSMFASLVGESERRMRDALALAEAISPCIVWCEELEKSLAGTSGSGNLDSGVGKRLLGTLLTFMAERKGDVFFFATANQVQFLPPEILRKGRFDEIFFLSLPTTKEKMSIFDIHLRKRNRDPKKFDLKKMAEAAKLFTGSECEEAVISAMYAAFSEGKELSTQYIVESCKTFVPLACSMKEEIARLTDWGKKRARPASSEEATKGDDLRRLLAGEMDEIGGE